MEIGVLNVTTGKERIAHLSPHKEHGSFPPFSLPVVLKLHPV